MSEMANSFPSTLTPPSTFPLSKIVIELKLFILQLQSCLLLNVNSYLFSSLGFGWKGKKASFLLPAQLFRNTSTEALREPFFVSHLRNLIVDGSRKTEDNLVISNFNKIQFTVACNSSRQEATSPKWASMIVSFSRATSQCCGGNLFTVSLFLFFCRSSFLGDISDDKVRVDRARSAHSNLLRGSNPLESASA